MYKTRIKNLELQTDRYEYLPFVLFGHNTSIQTNLTPNFKGPYKKKEEKEKKERKYSQTKQ